MTSVHGSPEEHTPTSPCQDAVGGWDAASARGYYEHCLADELWRFAQLYGYEDLMQQLASEGQRLGFRVQPEGV